MSYRSWPVCIVAVLALATVSVDVSAKGLSVAIKGGGGKGFHHHHNRGYGYGAYGGVYAAGQTKVETVAVTQQPLPVSQPAYALKCSPSEEFKVVPSAEGGTREIKIRRC